MWAIFSLISASVYSIRSIFEKIYVHKVNKYILALAVRLFALPLFVIPLIAYPELRINPADLSPQFWLATIYVSVISTPIEMIFFYKALEKAEVSFLVPLLALSPLLTSLINYFVFKEIPSPIGIIGLIIIIAGIYLLNLNKQQVGILAPFKHLANHQASRYISVMLISYSIGIIIDKIAIKGANPYVYALINYLLVSISLIIIALIKAREHLPELAKNFKPFLLIGLIVAVYTILRFLALSQANSSYVSAILSTSTVFTTLLGLVIFNESNWKLKILVALMATIGVICLKLA